jgi:hypothetical protein
LFGTLNVVTLNKIGRPDGWIKYREIWKREGRNGRRCNKTGNGETETDGDFFVTVDPKNWKRLKKEEEED